MGIQLNDPNNANVSVTPDDFLNMSHYGIIFICTHGQPYLLECGPIFSRLSDDKTRFVFQDQRKQDWISNHGGTRKTEWDWAYAETDYPYYTQTNSKKKTYLPRLIVYYTFFANNVHLNDSIVFMDACLTAKPSEVNMAGTLYHIGANTVIGCDKVSMSYWSRLAPYYFFYYMIYGFKQPNLNFLPSPINLADPNLVWNDPVGPEIPPAQNAPRLSVLEAFQKLEEVHLRVEPNKYVNSDGDSPANYCTLYMLSKDPGNTYLPGSLHIGIHKDK
jgi:hypothetical protein